MKSELQVVSEYTEAQAKAEAHYVEIRDVVGRSISKIQQIRLAIANFELKVSKASAELESELKCIDNNFSGG